MEIPKTIYGCAYTLKENADGSELNEPICYTGNPDVKPISNEQFKYGMHKLNELASKWDVTESKAFHIVTDILENQEVFEWVNLDNFIVEHTNGRRT